MLRLDGKKTLLGVLAPEILVFFHIPKTGGTTMHTILQRVHAGAHFNVDFGEEAPDSALWFYSTERVLRKYDRLSPLERSRIRCVSGDHVNYSVSNIFDRPSKFLTIVRRPVDRTISNFFHSKTRWQQLPCHQRIKDLTLEQYMDEGISPDLDNQQVRMLSGCAELDPAWGADGRALPTPPVERRHLEQAKKNIEGKFVVAASLAQFDQLVWFLKRLYNVPAYRTLFHAVNESKGSSQGHTITEPTRRRLEMMNEYDAELYEWVEARFAQQIETLEPSFSQEIKYFNVVNRPYQMIRRSRLLAPAFATARQVKNIWSTAPR